MHVLSLLENWLSSNHVIAHKARLRAVLKPVRALLDGAKLSLTHLGRSRHGQAFVKHHIKSIDRLLGNTSLRAERTAIYAHMAQSLLSASSSPLILVDWTDYELERQFLILKAAVPAGGRALTIYEEVDPLSHYNNPTVHRNFLAHLKAILPDNVIPIMVTDAGFRGPWFKSVEALGWHYIGRVRNLVKYFDEPSQQWVDTRTLYTKATARVRHLGRLCLARSNHYYARLYLVRSKRSGALGRPKPKRYANNDRQYRKLSQDPWLLVTSLEHCAGAGQRIRNAYATRMQIEETFRDLKNHRWGLALRYARSNSRDRSTCDVRTLVTGQCGKNE